MVMNRDGLTVPDTLQRDRREDRCPDGPMKSTDGPRGRSASVTCLPYEEAKLSSHLSNTRPDGASHKEGSKIELLV